MEMVLASMDLWDTVDGSKKAPPSNANPKVLKDYQKHVKKLCSSLTSIWGPTNLRTSRVAKDQRRHEKPFGTFTK